MTGTALVSGIGLQGAEQLKAVHVGHVDVGQNEADGFGFEYVEGLDAVAGFDNFAEGHLGLDEHSLQDLPDRRGIIDDHDVKGHSMRASPTMCSSEGGGGV